MKSYYLLLGIAAALGLSGCLSGCNHSSKTPDVSDIKVQLQIERFDQDLFAMDSTKVPEELPGLVEKYPNFTPLFIRQVMNLQSAADTPAVVYGEMRKFLAQNQVLKDSVFQKFSNLDGIQKELENDFRYVKYYYPDSTIPKIITYIGNFGYREMFTNDGLGISLDFYMGNKFSYYQIPEVLEVFPAYLSRKFSPEYLPVNTMNALIDDFYPIDDDNDTASTTLLEQLIDRGKRLYVLNKFLPNTADTLKLGYTGAQFEWCKANEGQIWNFLLQANVLYNHDPEIIKNYMSDAPTTQNMPTQAPGNIGSFVGWQIIKKYIARKGDMSPQKLMAVPPKDLFSDAQYNPK